MREGQSDPFGCRAGVEHAEEGELLLPCRALGFQGSSALSTALPPWLILSAWGLMSLRSPSLSRLGSSYLCMAAQPWQTTLPKGRDSQLHRLYPVPYCDPGVELQVSGQESSQVSSFLPGWPAR